MWLVDCPGRDVQETMSSLNSMFSILSGFEAGIATQAVADSPNGAATGFQVLCYENAKNSVKGRLASIGIPDTDMHWIPESELRKQFQEWKQQQSKRAKATSRSENRKRKALTLKLRPRVAGQGNLFELVVEETQAHPAFLSMRDLPHYESARKIMNELYTRMGDPNGNFVTDFQSYGYHARVFELCCFAYLESHGFNIDRSYESPDFLVSVGDAKLAVEAATSNPSVGLNEDISLTKIVYEEPSEDLLDKSMNEFPVRMGNLLLRKLRKRYWEQPHCQNIPIVLIVSPLYEPGSVFNIDDSLARYLYGGWDVFPAWVKYNGIFTRYVPIVSHTFEGRQLPSNFFSMPLSRHISAVI